MKQIYTITLLTLLALSAQSRPVNTVTTWWGDWSVKGNWSLNRTPQNGDSIVIPAGYAIVLDKNASFTSLYINVMGNLTLQKTMTLDNQSTVKVALGGQINRWGASPTTEIIILDGKHKFDQNDPARINGFAVANSTTGTSPNGFSMNASLPVTFCSFYAVKNNSDILLTWSTAQEFNNNNFEIQRSTDGSNWAVIALVMGAGNSSTTSQYSYTDKNNASATV
ncbi:MAG TPA: G8 domain-containing protein, partial [Chitinophagaceae bacterium]|nr:G8 domain-containing protein [Chitinophagaceae bacterium]